PLERFEAPVPPDAVAALPAMTAHEYRAVPVAIEPRVLHVATDDPDRPRLIEDLAVASRMSVRLRVATPTDVTRALERCYSPGPRIAAPSGRLLPTQRFEVRGIQLRWPRLIALRHDRMLLVEGRSLVLAWTIEHDELVPTGAWSTGWVIGRVEL